MPKCPGDVELAIPPILKKTVNFRLIFISISKIVSIFKNMKECGTKKFLSQAKK